MTPERFQRVAEVFREACRRKGDEQAAYLDETCANDATLCGEVERLLAADDGAPATVAAPPEPETVTPNVPHVSPMSRSPDELTG